MKIGTQVRFKLQDTHLQGTVVTCGNDGGPMNVVLPRCPHVFRILPRHVEEVDATAPVPAPLPRALRDWRVEGLKVHGYEGECQIFSCSLVHRNKLVLGAYVDAHGHISLTGEEKWWEEFNARLQQLEPEYGDHRYHPAIWLYWMGRSRFFGWSFFDELEGSCP